MKVDICTLNKIIYILNNISKNILILEGLKVEFSRLRIYSINDAGRC